MGTVFGKHLGAVLSNSTTKKVCVKRHGKDILEGYVFPRTFQHSDGIEVLARSAEAVFVPYSQIRCVYFVREFGRDPDGTQRKLFSTRPKLGGLWVRVRFHDGEELEGVIPNDLCRMDRHGVTLTPPDSKGNAQRVFVPRDALEKFVVVGVIGRPRRRRMGPRVKKPEGQKELFPRAAASGQAAT